MSTSKPIKSNRSSTYVQLEPGTQAMYIGDCVAVDSIPDPRGDKSLVQCIGPYGSYVTLADKRGAPGVIDFTLENLLFPAKSWLEDINCPFTVYVLQNCGGKRGVFADWIRGVIIENCDITDAPMGNLAQRNAQDEITHSHNISGWPPRIDLRQITTSRITSAEVQNMNTIDACSRLLCGDDCGPQTEPCEVLVCGANCNTGVATANGYRSTDGGATWTVFAADPFGVNTENIISIRCFVINNLTTRILALRSTNAAAPLDSSYSDDNGATWTEVAVGVTNAEAAVTDQALMVIDDQHIWACTSLGRMFKSINGGVSWTEQTTHLASFGANSVSAVHFADENVGYSCGVTGLVCKTLDGGTNWAACTAVTGAPTLNTIWVFSKYRVIVGTATGLTFMTWDGGVTWTQLANFTGSAAGSVKNIKFVNDKVGFMVHQTAAPIFYVHRTIDGGYSWQRMANPSTFTGGNAVIPCNVNKAFAVGNAQGGTAVIAGVSG